MRTNDLGHYNAVDRDLLQCDARDWRRRMRPKIEEGGDGRTFDRDREGELRSYRWRERERQNEPKENGCEMERKQGRKREERERKQERG